MRRNVLGLVRQRRPAIATREPQESAEMGSSVQRQSSLAAAMFPAEAVSVPPASGKQIAPGITWSRRGASEEAPRCPGGAPNARRPQHANCGRAPQGRLRHNAALVKKKWAFRKRRCTPQPAVGVFSTRLLSGLVIATLELRLQSFNQQPNSERQATKSRGNERRA